MGKVWDETIQDFVDLGVLRPVSAAGAVPVLAAEVWAVLKVWREVIPCRISEIEFAGERFVRAELIRSDGSLFSEQLIKPSLITRITMVDADVAKAMCDRLKPKRIAPSRASSSQEDAA